MLEARPAGEGSAQERGEAMKRLSQNDISAIVLDVVLDTLAGHRLSVIDAGRRVLAMLTLRNHWRVDGMSLREVARRTGISHTALNRATKTVRVSLHSFGSSRKEKTRSKRSKNVKGRDERS